MILTDEEIANAANVPSTGGSGPMPALRAVERATLEKAARLFDDGDKSALWPEEIRDLLLFWANQDADGRLRETQRAGL